MKIILIPNNPREAQSESRAYKCHRPKMTNHAGRTWDSLGYVEIDDKKHKAFCDTTWGWYGYFSIGELWYKFRMG